MALKYGVEYSYQDYRHTYFEGQERAKELGLYMQKYCGCIFSKLEALLQKKISKYLKKINIKSNTENIRKIIQEEKSLNNGILDIEKVVEKYRLKTIK